MTADQPVLEQPVLDRAVAAMLAEPVHPHIAGAAERLMAALSSDAVLFYGSNLRRDDLEGVVDFYVLHRRPARGMSAVLWPDVGYHEIAIGGARVRAKVAVMSLAQFARAAAGEGADTTVWARFCQPARLVAARDAAATQAVTRAVADAIQTAARFALALGPRTGDAAAYWLALFRQTYRAELRIERQSRADTILAAAPAHYRMMLPLAWAAQGVVFARNGEQLSPEIDEGRLRRWRRQWTRRRLLGKPLNAARLVKASFTFEGAARYALWKIERHSGLRIALTPWRERHPILAAPGVLLRLWQARRA